MSSYTKTSCSDTTSQGQPGPASTICFPRTLQACVMRLHAARSLQRVAAQPSCWPLHPRGQVDAQNLNLQRSKLSVFTDGPVETAVGEIPQKCRLWGYMNNWENIHNVGLYPPNHGGNPSFYQMEGPLGGERTQNTQPRALRREHKLALEGCNGRVNYTVSEQVHDTN